MQDMEGLKLEKKKEGLKELVKQMYAMMFGEPGEAVPEEDSSLKEKVADVEDDLGLSGGEPEEGVDELAEEKKNFFKRGSKIPSKGKSAMSVMNIKAVKPMMKKYK